MLVTLLSDGITLLLQPTIKVLEVVTIRQFPVARYTVFPSSTEILVNEIHSRNASIPILVTLLGIAIPVKAEQL